MSEQVIYNPARISLENCRDVYISGKDEGIPFPQDCIALQCPGTSADLSIKLARAEAIEKAANPQIELILDDEPRRDSFEIRERAHEISKEIGAEARGIVYEAGKTKECRVSEIFTWCWRTIRTPIDEVIES